jgi:ABC-type bacteriocin/lantibiotic exporter with double-glycine peptidase domain
MILAYQGAEVTEEELVRAADLQPGGVTPEELAQLARSYGFAASEQQLETADLQELVAREKFPIVFLYRRLIDGIAEVHAVVLLRFSRLYVSFLDPLRGRRRVTVRKFEDARRWIGNWVVVWEPK